MRKICFENDPRYMSLTNLTTKLNIFKEGDNKLNELFQNLLDK
jgi:hypothetical protein